MERLSRPPLPRNRTSGSIRDEQLARGSRTRQSSHDSKQQRGTSARAPSPEGPPYACPYSKHDPDRYSHKNVEEQDYRNCSTGYWTSIPRLKQHLYRTHDRSLRCCRRCWQNFPNDESLRKHLETQDCHYRPVPEDKMDAEKHQKVKERIQGKPTESWYTIYQILFPGDDLPPSPFAEWVTGSDLRSCFKGLAQRLPQLLFQAAVEQVPEARRMRLERDTTFPTTPEIIQRAVLQCQKEFGAAMHMLHVFDSEPPTLATSSRGTLTRPRQSSSPHQPRRQHNVSEVDDEDDSSSGASYYETPVPALRPAGDRQSYAPRSPAEQRSMSYHPMDYIPATMDPAEDILNVLGMTDEDFPTYNNPEDDWSQY